MTYFHNMVIGRAILLDKGKERSGCTGDLGGVDTDTCGGTGTLGVDIVATVITIVGGNTGVKGST